MHTASTVLGNQYPDAPGAQGVPGGFAASGRTAASPNAHFFLADEAKGQEMGKKEVIRKRKIKGEAKEGGKRQKRYAGSGREKEEEEEEEEDSYGQGKKGEGSQGGVRRERKGAGKAIAAALDRIGTTAQSFQRSKTELAIEKLQDEYGLVLSIEDLVKAFQLMENEVKASVFIALQNGSARDRWLAESLEKM